jgi:VanZ family protein
MGTVLLRVFSAAYWVYLTILLLVPCPMRLAPNPATTRGLDLVIARYPDRGVHLTCMTLLAWLVFASRWAIPHRVLLGVLLGYGILTESLQWFVPARTVELLDYTENVLGILAGTALWRLGVTAAAKWRPAHGPAWWSAAPLPPDVA